MKLYFRYAAMNSGKTTALLQVAHNYEEQGMRALIVKPGIDTKGGKTIVSRLGIQREVDILLSPEDKAIEMLEQFFDEVDCFLIDEAQFLSPNQVDELYRIAKIYEIPVIAYGLRCDFAMNGFPGATRLLQLADDLEELKTICKCGKKATQNMRFVNNEPVFTGEQVCIDNQDSINYDATCGRCYLLKRDKKWNS